MRSEATTDSTLEGQQGDVPLSATAATKCVQEVVGHDGEGEHGDSLTASMIQMEAAPGNGTSSSISAVIARPRLKQLISLVLQSPTAVDALITDPIKVLLVLHHNRCYLYLGL
jgi:hypothetical protein